MNMVSLSAFHNAIGIELVDVTILYRHQVRTLSTWTFPVAVPLGSIAEEGGTSRSGCIANSKFVHSLYQPQIDSNIVQQTMRMRGQTSYFQCLPLTSQIQIAQPAYSVDHGASPAIIEEVPERISPDSKDIFDTRQE